jgi:hypothetical protein
MRTRACDQASTSTDTERTERARARPPPPRTRARSPPGSGGGLLRRRGLPSGPQPAARRCCPAARAEHPQSHLRAQRMRACAAWRDVRAMCACACALSCVVSDTGPDRRGCADQGSHKREQPAAPIRLRVRASVCLHARMSPRLSARACEHASARACVRLRVRACARAFMRLRARVRACGCVCARFLFVRLRVRASARLRVHARVRTGIGAHLRRQCRVKPDRSCARTADMVTVYCGV